MWFFQHVLHLRIFFFFSDEKEEYLSFKKKKEKDQFKFPVHSPAKEKKLIWLNANLQWIRQHHRHETIKCSHYHIQHILSSAIGLWVQLQTKERAITSGNIELSVFAITSKVPKLFINFSFVPFLFLYSHAKP